MNKIEEALKNNPTLTFNDRNSRWIATGKISEGVNLEIIFETGIDLNPTGKIISVYPVL